MGDHYGSRGSIGTFYLKHDNSIGINLSSPNQDQINTVINHVKQLFNPAGEVKSVVPPYFYVNVAFDNFEMQKIFEQIGKGHCKYHIKSEKGEKMFKVGDRLVGQGHRPFVIAEISANHGGDIERAKQTMLAAKLAGADAVKIQTYTPDTMTLNCDKEDFLISEGLWSGYNLFNLYQEAYTPYEWHSELFSFAQKIQFYYFRRHSMSQRLIC